MLVVGEVANEVLPDPLLRREGYVTLAQGVENDGLLAFFFDICLYGGQV